MRRWLRRLLCFLGGHVYGAQWRAYDEYSEGHPRAITRCASCGVWYEIRDELKP